MHGIKFSGRCVFIATWICLGSAFWMSGCTGEMQDEERDEGVNGRPGTTMPAPGEPGYMGGDGGVPVGPGEDGGGEPACEDARTFFEGGVWPVVAKDVCVGCHIQGGVAPTQGSKFVLWSQATLDQQPDLKLSEFFKHNMAQFKQFAKGGAGREAGFVRKALGQDAHGGGQVVKEGSPEFEALIDFADRLADAQAPVCEEESEERPSEELLIWRTPAETYRKAAILFAGRLPTVAETRAITQASDEKAAWQEVDRLLEGVMQEETFEHWVTYAWNEVLFFRGMTEFEANFPHQIISNDFGANGWVTMNDKPKDGKGIVCTNSDGKQLNWQRFGYESAEMCESPVIRRYLSGRLGWSFAEEPLRLIAWIVKEGRPFTEILTTEKVAMNYYSSLSWYGSARPQENPFVAAFPKGVPTERVNIGGEMARWRQVEVAVMDEFRIMDSVRRTDGFSEVLGNGERQSGWRSREVEQYPRAGLLTSQMFLNRYPTTSTNVNRHRSWAFYNLFLGIDILELAERRGDPTKAELESEAPVIEDPNCNVCHNVMDPVAGMFKDFSGFMGEWDPQQKWPPGRKALPMLEPGFGKVGELAGTPYDPMRDGEAALVALAKQTVKDPKFSRRMVEHAFYQVIGRYPLRLDTSEQGARGRGLRRAYELERAYLKDANEAFVQSNHDMRVLLRHLATSPMFRVRTLVEDAKAQDEETAGELEVWGNGQLTTLEMLLRRIEAAMGRPWAKRAFLVDDRSFNNKTDDPANDYLLRFDTSSQYTGVIDGGVSSFYGGIDFYIYTDRLRQSSSAMSSMAQRIANEVACASVAQEFGLPAASRAMLSEVEADFDPASHGQEIRQALKTLHERFLGPHRALDAEVDASYALFVEVQKEGAKAVSEGMSSATLPPQCQALAIAPGQSGTFTPVTKDPQYIIRAYMAVISVLVLDFEFLHDF